MELWPMIPVHSSGRRAAGLERRSRWPFFAHDLRGLAALRDGAHAAERLRALERTRAVVAFFATPEDARRLAPGGRPLGLGQVRVRVAAAVVARRALGGALAAALLAGLGVAIVGATDLVVVGGVAVAPLVALAALLGAIAGAASTRIAARAVERELEEQRVHGFVESVVEAREVEAARLAEDLERRGALEATVLPLGVSIVAAAPARDDRRVDEDDRASGGTLVAGGPLLAAAARLLGPGVRVAALARAPGATRAAEHPVAVARRAPEEDWWRGFDVADERPRRLGLSDGDLLVAGPEAARVVDWLAAHTNDTVASALARVAESCECPDASAWVVSDAVDDGSVGVLLVGPLAARRHAVERLSFAASASSEGRARLETNASLKAA